MIMLESLVLFRSATTGRGRVNSGKWEEFPYQIISSDQHNFHDTNYSMHLRLPKYILDGSFDFKSWYLSI